MLALSLFQLLWSHCCQDLLWLLQSLWLLAIWSPKHSTRLLAGRSAEHQVKLFVEGAVDGEFPHLSLESCLVVGDLQVFYSLPALNCCLFNPLLCQLLGDVLVEMMISGSTPQIVDLIDTTPEVRQNLGGSLWPTRGTLG